ncbi:MAG: hypothetical protein F4202_00405 [Cenarchaeum sp. SB0677_bin_16]|nr:hypothetical protein [Cenarchaeum sp. SB0677_bin_16]
MYISIYDDTMNKFDLAIFERLKTQEGKVTVRAWRQRCIIRILAESPDPADRTRIGLAKNMAQINNLRWQTVYPGIFNDIDNIMKPLDLVRESGRLPTKRGPKAVQEQGSPYYELTKKGIMVALSVREVTMRESLVRQILADDDVVNKESMSLLVGTPLLFGYMMERYVEAWCEQKIDLLPLDLKKLSRLKDETLLICNDLLKNFTKLEYAQRKNIRKLLDNIVYRE